MTRNSYALTLNTSQIIQMIIILQLGVIILAGAKAVLSYVITVLVFSILYLDQMKLFLTGDLITPIAFYRWKGKWYEAILHGENYGLGYDLSGKPYIFNVDDIEAFDLFRSQINRYLSFMNFYDIPYLKRQKAFNNIDLRCSLAIHLYLKRSIEDNNSFIIFDKLIDYTIALETMIFK